MGEGGGGNINFRTLSENISTLRPPHPLPKLNQCSGISIFTFVCYLLTRACELSRCAFVNI